MSKHKRLPYYTGHGGVDVKEANDVISGYNELTAKVEALISENESLELALSGAEEAAKVVEIENKRLLAVIDEAPHIYTCRVSEDIRGGYGFDESKCNCFKSKARMEPPTND